MNASATTIVADTERPSAGLNAGGPRAGVPEAGRSRVILENVVPNIDFGRFAAKRSVGETVRIEVDAFTDGHDKLSVALRYRSGTSGEFREIDMQPLVNDRWFAEFDVHQVGWVEFTIGAWVDRFATWRYDFQKRVNAGQDVSVDILIGADLVDEAANGAAGETAEALRNYSEMMRKWKGSAAVEVGLDTALQSLMRRHAPRLFQTDWPSTQKIWVDRAKARFSSWYEFFPRSAGAPGQHGNFKDVEARLPYVEKLGFDVVYLPPIHPIGRAFRKGPNNSTTAGPDDVGSPWAIGGPEGGHDAIHPQLGTIEDFDRMIEAGKKRGIEFALDLAFQCSPDHPYVKQHPEWFKHRPDGTIQYAENPPKRYQDIYPFDFECEGYEDLWNELLRVTMHWVDHGVRIFRVDNPHTKPFPFWEWLIAQVKQREPDVLFLAEAFTRPKVMYRLAKLGFTQSYTYFAWRNDPWTLKEYFSELTKSPVVDFFRPNAWPNTPDILNEYLQTDARSAYIVRAVLAATLSANYGIYGPAFELMEGRPAKQGSEEYLDSEKYQIRQWDLNSQNSLSDLLGLLNRIRKSNPALQHDRGLVFHTVDNGSVICFSKQHGDNIIVVAANTDPYHTQWANIDLNLAALGITPDQSYQVHDLLSGQRFRWQGYRQVVGLDPGAQPAHIFALRRKARTEHDFDYYL